MLLLLMLLLLSLLLSASSPISGEQIVQRADDLTCRGPSGAVGSALASVGWGRAQGAQSARAGRPTGRNSAASS